MWEPLSIAFHYYLKNLPKCQHVKSAPKIRCEINAYFDWNVINEIFRIFRKALLPSERSKK